MAEYKYAIICEDIAQSTFVSHILPVLAREVHPAVNVIEETEFPIMASNDDQVVRKCHDACRLAFVSHNVQMFVVCRDIDSVELRAYEQKKQELRQRFPVKWKEKTIICLPVQFIEHWILYLIQRGDDPETTKTASTESIPSRDAKRKVYGNIQRREERASVVAKHCSNADVQWLREHSQSFCDFATNVHTVLEQIAAA